MNSKTEFNPEIWESLLEMTKIDGTVPSIAKITAYFPLSNRAASGYYFALNNYAKITNDIQLARTMRKDKFKIAELNSLNREQKKELLLYEARVNFLEAIDLLRDHDFKEIKIVSADPGADENTVVSTLGDAHVEEHVDPVVINNLNTYGLDEAEKRIRRYFSRLVYMTNMFRKGGLVINHLVLGILGDMITGYIHEEGLENNEASPTEASVFVAGLINDGLKFLSEKGDFKSIKVIMIRGNHGRTSKKKKFATGYKNSYEWMMYTMIHRLFKQDLTGYDNLEFIIPKGEFAYVDVYHTTNSFSHGDHFRYIGGVGGVIIPFQKWIYRMNDILPANKRWIGHWHQYINIPGGNINSSVIGYNAFAMGIGAKPEPPMMQYQLIDSKRGYTINTPIYLIDW